MGGEMLCCTAKVQTATPKPTHTHTHTHAFSGHRTQLNEETKGSCIKQVSWYLQDYKCFPETHYKTNNNINNHNLKYQNILNKKKGYLITFK